VKIVVVVKDADARRRLEVLVRAAGHQPILAVSIAQAKPLLREPFDAAIIDMTLRDGSGIDLLRFIRRRGLSLPVALVMPAGSNLVSEAGKLNPTFFGTPIDIKEFQSWLREIQEHKPTPPAPRGKEGYWN
jgi:DNA-binding NtrC family response regulator